MNIDHRKKKLPNELLIKNAPSSVEYRRLKNQEIQFLETNSNYSDDWNLVLITNNTDLKLIKNTEFHGTVYIGVLERKTIDHENTYLRAGIYNSCLTNVSIGKNCTVKNVQNLHNYIIDDDCILFNIAEVSFFDKAGFETENRKVNNEGVKLDIGNENGGRQITAFENILPADAFLWSRFREDDDLLRTLTEITEKTFSKSDSIGQIGAGSVIKNTGRIEDCKIGSFTEINGATLLKKLTIHSSKEEPTFIGDGTELISGVVGYSNKIIHGPKCINFVTGRNAKIELGARVIHTLVGANSTIACCEVLNNLVFPFHEQHHNNSFLIASTLFGQSNIAAGATIGSNHNSRAADGEILAGRGFWPGLNSSYKHNSRFASFSLIAKGSYETELDVKLPFSLISKDPKTGSLQIFPAFWFRYNMYALARNSWKFKNRDRRIIKEQNIEMDYLAPDTAAEILNGIQILEQAIEDVTGSVPVIDEKKFSSSEEIRNVVLTDLAPKEKVLVIKPLQAIWLYRIMLSYFAAKEVLKHILENSSKDIESIVKKNASPRKWMNFGGQLVEENDYLKLISDIKNSELNSWESIHNRYNDLWEKYKNQKRDFAIQCWLQKEKKSPKKVSKQDIIDLLVFSLQIDELVLTWTKEARLKDYTNPFRKTVYRNEKEMEAVLGKYEDDAFVKEMENQHIQFTQDIKNAVSELTKN